MSKSSSHNHFFSSQLKLTFAFPSWSSFLFIQVILGNLISLLILQKKKIFVKSNWIYCFCFKYSFIFTGFTVFTVLRCKYIFALKKKKAECIYYTLLGNIRPKACTRYTLKWKLLCAHTSAIWDSKIWTSCGLNAQLFLNLSNYDKTIHDYSWKTGSYVC